MSFVLFYLFVGISLIGAMGIVLSKNLLHSALLLLLSLLGVAAVYIFAGADFIAVSQIMVYVGGVLVLLLFGVMFTSKQKEEAIFVDAGREWQGAVLGISLFAMFVYAIKGATWLPAVLKANNLGETTAALGMTMMTDYLLAFEAIAILLLLVLIGAINIVSGNRG